MGTTIGRNIFALSGETGKDSSALSYRQQYPALFNLLDSCPFHAFSPIGKRNVCNRFHITERTLEQVLLTYERPGEVTEVERAAADLAHLIIVTGWTAKPIQKRKQAASKGQEGARI